MQNEWLSLGDAAQILGVHPSTVRDWSNKGLLPVHRTRGGHRRYRRIEIELWEQSQLPTGESNINLIVQNAMQLTRSQISLGCLEQEQWYQKLDEGARSQFRLSGRTMMQGMIDSLNFDGDKAMAEARSLGYEYASRGWRHELTSVDATRAFIFFRKTLLESMLSLYESAAIRSPLAWSHLFRKINAFTDIILVTLLETYETYSKSGR